MLGILLLSSALLTVPKVPVVALQPLGEVDASLVDTVAGHVRTAFGTQVTVLPPQPLPEAAFYSPRKRYRAEGLLEFLDRSTPPEYTRVIGITSRDISVTKGQVFDWGVFGVAFLDGRPGIVSTYRLKAGAADSVRPHRPGGRPPGEPCSPLLQRRVDNVVTHELGHTFGLPHCETAGCVMNDAEGSIAPVDGSTGRFCPVCLSRVSGGL